MKTKITLFAYWLLCNVGLTFAQPGTLDITFGTRGKVTTLVGSTGNHCHAYATAIQSDGKIVVAGDFLSSNGNTNFVVIRYNSNGRLDNTFGGNGKVGIDFSNNNDVALAVAIQPADGKIIVAGYSHSLPSSFPVKQNAVVARLTTSGSLDNSFNSGGEVIIDFGGLDAIHAVALQADGKIVLAGESFTSEGIYRTAVARLNGSDGHLDDNFGVLGPGRVITLVGKKCSGWDVAIQSDAKIVVVGNSFSGRNNGSAQNFFAVRYNSDGTLDNAFGNNGATIIDFGGEDYAKSVALQANGRIVIAGYLGINGGDFALTELGPAGIRIGNFGVNGKVITNIGNSGLSNGYSVAIQTDGKILVAGTVEWLNPTYDFALVRYNANGSLDSSFGTNAIVTTEFGNHDAGLAVALQRDGKIVVAGFSESGDHSISIIAVARYNGDPVKVTASSENIAAAIDKKLSASSTIKIFPNPAKNILSIDGIDASATKTISIVNMNGRIVQTATTANGTHTWNIASLSAGTYYLVIDDKKKRTSLRFVKE